MYSNNQTLCYRCPVWDDGPRGPSVRHLDVVANHNTHMFEVSIDVANGDLITRCFRLPSEAADFAATVLSALDNGAWVDESEIHTAIIEGLNTGGVA